ncbi:MAG: hypothetical protein R3190_17860, partial [Thermoanaerobaculia bacterium]|nr:hypothetical protein [Thermoanaerobaculia bacterium]
RPSKAAHMLQVTADGELEALRAASPTAPSGSPGQPPTDGGPMAEPPAPDGARPLPADPLETAPTRQLEAIAARLHLSPPLF